MVERCRESVKEWSRGVERELKSGREVKRECDRAKERE